MDSLKTVVKGLLLGLGLGCGLLLVFLYYSRFVEVPNKMAVRRSLIMEMESEARALKVDLQRHELVDGSVVVAGVVENSGDVALINVIPKVEVYGTSNRLLASCYGRKIQLMSAGDSVGFEDACKPLRGPLSEEIESVKVIGVPDVR